MQLIIFINNCLLGRSIPHFNTYYSSRKIPYPIRDRGLDPDFARTNIGYLSVKNVSTRLWNALPQDLESKRTQKNFRKHITRHFITNYTINNPDT